VTEVDGELAEITDVDVVPAEELDHHRSCPLDTPPRDRCAAPYDNTGMASAADYSSSRTTSSSAPRATMLRATSGHLDKYRLCL
jgi:hypothetical protein